MARSVRVLELILQVSVLYSHGYDEIARNYTLYMPNMTINSSLVHLDCSGDSIISNITFGVAYAIAADTECYYKSDIFMPIEWTEQSEKLANYHKLAKTIYTSCITNNTCNGVDLSEWRHLAMEEYHECRLCNLGSEELPCSYTIVSRYSDPVAFDDIIDSMYLTINFTCTRQLAEVKHIQLSVVKTSDEVFYIQLLQEKFNCSTSEFPTAVSVTEQVEPTRVRHQYNNSHLLTRIGDGLRDHHLDTNLTFITADWTVTGGYSWGVNTSRKSYPSHLDLYYACVNHQPSPANDNKKHRVTRARLKNLTEKPAAKEIETGVIIIVVVSIAVTCVIFLLVVYIALRKKQRCQEITTELKFTEAKNDQTA